MPTLTVWHYDTPLGAEAGEVRLKALQEHGSLTVHDAVTVAWMPGAHEPHVGHFRHATSGAAGKGSVLGALVGMLVLAPAAGAVAGAGVAAVAQRLRGTGIDKAFLEDVTAHLTPGTSAMLVLSSDADLDAVRATRRAGVGERRCRAAPRRARRRRACCPPRSRRESSAAPAVNRLTDSEWPVPGDPLRTGPIPSRHAETDGVHTPRTPPEQGGCTMSSSSSPEYEASTKRLVARGTAVFAGVMLITVAVFQILEGIAAIAKDSFFVTGLNYTFEFDVTAWGWIHLIIGIVAVAAGLGIVAGQAWGMLVGIIIATIGARQQLRVHAVLPVLEHRRDRVQRPRHLGPVPQSSPTTEGHGAIPHRSSPWTGEGARRRSLLAWAEDGGWGRRPKYVPPVPYWSRPGLEGHSTHRGELRRASDRIAPAKGLPHGTTRPPYDLGCPTTVRHTERRTSAPPVLRASPPAVASAGPRRRRVADPARRARRGRQDARGGWLGPTADRARREARRSHLDPGGQQLASRPSEVPPRRCRAGRRRGGSPPRDRGRRAPASGRVAPRHRRTPQRRPLRP